ncbi:hypothetical protein Tco_1314177 [Tanacetum coccineum]
MITTNSRIEDKKLLGLILPKDTMETFLCVQNAPCITQEFELSNVDDEAVNLHLIYFVINSDFPILCLKTDIVQYMGYHWLRTDDGQAELLDEYAQPVVSYQRRVRLRGLTRPAPPQTKPGRPREGNIDEYWWRIYESGNLEVLES